MAQMETISVGIADASINDSQRERSGDSSRPNPDAGHRLIRAFLSIEQAALREAIVAFVVELSALQDKQL